MKIIAGIVSYQPDINRLLECIHSIPFGEYLVVVDNGSNNVDEVKKIVDECKNIHGIYNSCNEGIAKALNQIFEYAEKQKFEWVLCIDQDTILPVNMRNVYNRIYDSFLDKKDIAIICPRIHDRMTGSIWPVYDKSEVFKEVNKFITSGSLNRIDIWRNLGGFDEFLFIDEVDHDYSFRVVKEGYKIIQVRDVIIDHQIGNTKVKHFFGKRIFIRNHGAVRKYYIVRNMLYICKKQNDYIKIFVVRHAFLFMVKTLIYEDDKLNKLKACIKGFIDGCKSNLV